MKKKLLISWLLLTVGLSTHAQLQLPGTWGSTEHPIPRQYQLQSNWCWAASMQMLMNYYGLPETQCTIAGKLYLQDDDAACISTTCTCSNIVSLSQTAVCGDLNHATSRYVSLFDSFGFNATEREVNTEGLFTWDELRLRLPLMMTVQGLTTDVDRLHVVVATGYRQNPRTIFINDPWAKCNEAAGFVEVSSLTGVNGTSGVYTMSPNERTLRADGARTYIYEIISRVQPPVPVPEPTQLKEVQFTPTVRVPKVSPLPVPSPNPPRPGPSPIVIARDMYRVLYEQPRPKQPYQLLERDVSGRLRKSRLYTFSFRAMADTKADTYLKNPYLPAQRWVYGTYAANRPEIVVRELPNSYALEAVAFNLFFGTQAQSFPQQVRVKMDAKKELNIGRRRPYSIVVFNEFFYRFRRFRHNGQTYFFSLDNYPDLVINGKPFQKRTAYNSEAFLAALHQKTVAAAPRFLGK
ncbi:MAG: hypothetical protein EOO39_17240 [Cytophagaceae bacterium]|nr:MAG: hypothetical protein EOO39_17240 [Cytophagaceae bacterium]